MIELGGPIDEAFDGRAVAAALGRVTVLDLAGVERVSSHGVREWVQMMELADVEALYLARCAEPLVNRLLLVRAMLGQASVISFAAPYVCKEVRPRVRVHARLRARRSAADLRGRAARGAVPALRPVGALRR